MSKKLTFLFTILLFVITSCKDYRDDIKDIQDKVDNHEDFVSKVEDAFSSGKILTDIQQSDDERSYILIFSDGSTISLKKSNTEEFTPILQIDLDGYWTVSFDNGTTFTRVVDDSNFPIISTGKNGKQAKITVDDDGYYCIETFLHESPDNVLDVIKTSYSANHRSILSAIIKDENTGVITLKLSDGTEFTFDLEITYPTSIVVLNEAVKLNPTEDGQLIFRINPSNAYINLDSDNSSFDLDIVTELSRNSVSYVTKPSGYKITSIRNDTNDKGDVKEGQYIATISSLNNGKNPLERACIVITTKNSNGETIQISSNPFSIINGEGTDVLSVSINGAEGSRSGNTFYIKLPHTTNLTDLTPEFTGNFTSIAATGNTTSRSYSESLDFSNPVTFIAKGPDGAIEEYTVVITFSNLPTVYVKTTAEILSKENWVKNNSIRIFDTENQTKDYIASIKGRGNMTWGQPKKPYSIKLDSKDEVLGMPKHKRWCLIANWQDRTNIRNDVAFELARCLDGLEWTPHGQHVDLVLNGSYLGNYYLCEQIKIDKNRVNIDELESTDVAESVITGGYLLEFDSYFDEEYKFRSQLLDMPVNFKSPDEDVPQSQFDYISNYINSFEYMLTEHIDFAEIERLIDIDSYIDWWILHELTTNPEPNHPKSSYMYKKRDGKLYAGPVWDFDYRTFTESDEWIIKDAIWYQLLFSYPEFITNLKCRWESHREKLKEFPSYIDNIALKTQDSSLIDCKLWPLGSSFINGDERLTLQESTAKIKEMYIKRLEWMDKNIPNLEPNEISTDSYQST